MEFEQVVEFERDVHFLNQDGTDVVLPAGGYYVDPVQNGLRLKSADQEEAEKVVIVQAEEDDTCQVSGSTPSGVFEGR